MTVRNVTFKNTVGTSHESFFFLASTGNTLVEDITFDNVTRPEVFMFLLSLDYLGPLSHVLRRFTIVNCHTSVLKNGKIFMNMGAGTAIEFDGLTVLDSEFGDPIVNFHVSRVR